MVQPLSDSEHFCLFFGQPFSEFTLSSEVEAEYKPHALIPLAVSAPTITSHPCWTPTAADCARRRAFTLPGLRERSGAFTLQEQRGRSAFTLVEMLVVIVIISILLVAVIPAVNSLSKSSGRKGAANALLGAIEQARAEAIKTGNPTYLVFPTFTSGAQATLDRYNYKAYAIFEDDPATPATPKQLTPWKTLATGISFRSSSLAALPNPASDLTPILTIAFQPDTGATPVFRCIKFNADGGTDYPSTSFNLEVFEGYVNGGNEVPTSNPLIPETITISHLTGRAVHKT